MPTDAKFLVRCLTEQGKDNAIILLDLAGNIVAWLAGAESIFGYAHAEVIGRHVSLLFTAEDMAAGIPQHELDVARSDGRADDDRWLIRKDGGRFWAHGTTSALHDDKNQLVGFGKILIDRTEVHVQMETLRNELLACREAMHRKNTFIALLTHEVRNPLSVITNCAASLRLITTEPASKLVASIADQGRFMIRMVQDLQDSIRAAGNRIVLNIEQIILQDVLIQAADAVRLHAQHRRQTLHVNLVPTAVRVSVDPDRIRQAVINLLENAVKYTPDEGNIWLKFSTEGDEAVIRVEDDGRGIDKDALPDLFELFTRSASHGIASDRLGAGLGLGLPLVKELAALHGGSVQVRSAGANKGAEFVIRLPLQSGQDLKI